MESTGGHQRVPPLSPVEEVAFAAAGFVENHALPDRGVERASFETAITPANFVPGATRSTGTGFGSHQSDATHMFAEGEGEASTPRNARAQAKRAAQNNLKRKLEGLAARHESGTFLATHWTAQKKTKSECFKTPPRTSFGVGVADASNDGNEATEGVVVADLSDFLLHQNAAQAAGDLFNSPCGRDVSMDFKNSPIGRWDVVAQALARPEFDIASLNAGVMAEMACDTQRHTEKKPIEEEDEDCSVASDAGGARFGEVLDAFGDGDADGGRRTLRNLLVRHVISGIASDAVAGDMKRLSPCAEQTHTETETETHVSQHFGKSFFAAKPAKPTQKNLTQPKLALAPFDTPPRTGVGDRTPVLFRGRSCSKLKDLVAHERRASTSPSASAGEREFKF